MLFSQKEFILNGINFILIHNAFQFKAKIYLEMRGTAMGTCFANLFMGLNDLACLISQVFIDFFYLLFILLTYLECKTLRVHWVVHFYEFFQIIANSYPSIHLYATPVGNTIIQFMYTITITTIITKQQSYISYIIIFIISLVDYFLSNLIPSFRYYLDFAPFYVVLICFYYTILLHYYDVCIFYLVV